LPEARRGLRTRPSRRFGPRRSEAATVLDALDRPGDKFGHTVRTGISELRLTSLGESVLYLLAANAGRLVTREEMLDALWGTDYVAESNVVDRQIRNLRARLQDDWRKPRFIATVPGRGYRFLQTYPATGVTAT
jgi:DNA-binding response OmpR family regulator